MTEITEGAIEILGGLGCMFKQDVEVFVIGENFRVCCCWKAANMLESPFCISADSTTIKE